MTAVLKELYKDKSNLKVVNAAIYAKVYTDESVAIKDLVYPSGTLLERNAKFRAFEHEWNVDIRAFARAFWAEVDKKTDPDFRSFLEGLNTPQNPAAFNYNDPSYQPTIYFPYSEEFLEPDNGNYVSYDPVTTIVSAAEDADEGWGSQPYYVNGTLQGYAQVLINDDYAYTYPTQIIGVNGIELNDGTEDAPPPPPAPRA